MDVFSIGLQLAFAAVFVVVLLRYLRDRRPVNRDLVFVAGSVAGWFVLSTLNTLVPAIGTSVVRLSALFIFIQPVLTLRLVRHFVPVRRNLVLAAVAWSVVALIVSYAVGTRGNPLATGVVVGYFVFFESVGAVLLARAARSRVGYASTRLWVASIGTVLFAATVLVAGIGGASTPPGAPLNATLTFLSRLLALSAGLSYLVAFMPPQPLRRLQQRATAFDFGQSLIASPDRGPEALWQALAETAVQVAGARGAVVATGDPPVARAIAGTPPVPITIGEAAAFGDAPIEGEPARFSVPIGTESPIGALTVFAGGDPLFVEDDRVLLGLLAEQAARSAERQEAILERNVLESVLEDQSHELAESQARLDEEARFRVALEAHPGILLVVDPDGRIGYANAQALQSLRYVPDQIRAVHLRDLLTTAPAVGQATQGVQLAEARRRDGTTFPVDYAVSTFELGGDHLFDRGPDRHLGATPDRTAARHLHRHAVARAPDARDVDLWRQPGPPQPRRPPRCGTRQELIADVASEAERLHRLIENLLVLARVERGQDLAGDEPFLLQRVLPLIVERERSLWPGTNIEMTLPAGLPTVRGHDGYVGQVVRNLLSNAAKYAGDGATVEIVASREDSGVAVHILDNGAGILPEHADHLFDLYYRAPGAADRAPGAGIGLFVCRHIITALGGTIWARSRPEGGAEFGFELPIYEAEDEFLPSDVAEPGAPGVAAVS